jgi:outer membrane protein OmpA-like peptidoglycan-associated protein
MHGSKEDTWISIPGDTLFDFDKDVLKPEARGVLTVVAGNIRMHLSGAGSGSLVQIVGHTDSTADPKYPNYNQELSDRRAKAVAKWFIDTGKLTAAQVRTVGLGSSSPKVPNNTKENRAKNRRVEFHVFKVGQ